LRSGLICDCEFRARNEFTPVVNGRAGFGTQVATALYERRKQFPAAGMRTRQPKASQTHFGTTCCIVRLPEQWYHCPLTDAVRLSSLEPRVESGLELLLNLVPVIKRNIDRCSLYCDLGLVVIANPYLRCRPQLGHLVISELNNAVGFVDFRDRREADCLSCIRRNIKNLPVR